MFCIRQRQSRATENDWDILVELWCYERNAELSLREHSPLMSSKKANAFYERQTKIQTLMSNLGELRLWTRFFFCLMRRTKIIVVMGAIMRMMIIKIKWTSSISLEVCLSHEDLLSTMYPSAVKMEWYFDQFENSLINNNYITKLFDRCFLL